MTSGGLSDFPLVEDAHSSPTPLPELTLRKLRDLAEAFAQVQGESGKSGRMLGVPGVMRWGELQWMQGRYVPLMPGKSCFFCRK